MFEFLDKCLLYNVSILNSINIYSIVTFAVLIGYLIILGQLKTKIYYEEFLEYNGNSFSKIFSITLCLSLLNFFLSLATIAFPMKILMYLVVGIFFIHVLVFLIITRNTIKFAKKYIRLN